MSSDAKTLAFYDGAAASYAGKFGRSEPDGDMRDFMAELPAGGRVLDFGCGPGNSAAMLRDAGFRAEASDASQAMADLAREKFGIDVRVEPFDALNATDRFDGIWANFCLLHAPRADFPGHLARIHRALKPGGVLHLGLKTGTGELRDHLGRFYTYYPVQDLLDSLSDADFTVLASREGMSVGMAGTDDPFIIIRAKAQKSA